MKIFIPILVLWLVGFGCENMFHKGLSLKAANSKNETNIAEANSVHKHFKVSCILYSITILICLIIPLTELHWLLFFGCAMLIWPVFYDLFYGVGKTAFNSREKFALFFFSLYNFILSIIMLFFHYFAYMHVDFS